MKPLWARVRSRGRSSCFLPPVSWAAMATRRRGDGRSMLIAFVGGGVEVHQEFVFAEDAAAVVLGGVVFVGEVELDRAGGFGHRERSGGIVRGGGDGRSSARADVRVFEQLE